MNGENPFSPQLVMRRKSLEDLPKLEISTGYTLRHYKDGDDTEWEKLIKAAFNYDMDFEKEMKSKPYFKDERVLFICKDDIPAAMASAWRYDKNPEKTGYVHWVATHNEHKGKGLGYQVSLAVLHRMKYEGCTDAILETDDTRLPAINIYLKLGFEPEIIHENQPKRWEDILNNLRTK